MNALAFLIHLDEPLLATQPHSGEANSAVSYSFIPGSMIRGALIRAHLNHHPEADLAIDKNTRRLFFSGQTCFLNAYLADPLEQTRLLPSPLSWFWEKDGGKDDFIYDFAIKEASLEKPKHPEGKFCQLEDIVYLADPVRQVNVHNASTNRNRKQEDLSRVFRYEALAARQQFAGVIVAEMEEDLQTLKPLLENEVFMLGGSHTGGYGRITISQVEIQQNWMEYTPEPPADGITVVTLLSDAILRTSDGQIAADLDEALGIKRPKKDTEYRKYQTTRLVGGFNRKWGMPLPQAWALQAGSVFRFPAGATDETRLNQWVEKGIGERRAEGFGRIAVNWHTQPERTQSQFSEQRYAPPKLSVRSQELLQQMANGHLRTVLDQKLAEIVVNYRNFKGLPSPAQLSRVRLAARQAWLTEDGTAVIKHLDSLKGAEKDWRNARLDDKPLLKWIRDNSQLSDDKFAERFKLTDGMPQIAGVKGQLTDGIRLVYCARLIDGVMKMAIEHQKGLPGGGR